MPSASEPTLQKPATGRGDRIEVAKVLALMVVSFAVGFALVILCLKPESAQPPATAVEPEVAPEEQPPASERETPENRYGPSEEREPPDPASGRPVEPGEAEEPGSREGNAPPEVPPGKTPPGVELSGSALYLKCWDQDGALYRGDACGSLSVFEKRLGTRLYVVDRCKEKHAGERAEGKLSLGVEVDFQSRSLTFWSGASSTLEHATEVAACLRSDLAGLPIDGIDHDRERYRLFFTVLFGSGAAADQAQVPTAAASPAAPAKGRTVEVIMDRVRVRREPVDGEVFGRISSGNQVRLIGQKAGWCQVITPNGNEGWMTCEALGK